MVLKNPIRNEHREAFKNGEFEEIPADVLEMLHAEHEAAKPQKKEAKKAKDKEESAE